MKKPLIGARWDQESQKSRFLTAKKIGLLDFAEVTVPIQKNDIPSDLELPLFAHSAQNAIASSFGLNPKVYTQVKKIADTFDSPWIGEHLALLAPYKNGALGYVATPLLTSETWNVAKKNLAFLKDYYKRPVAIELGPSYFFLGQDFENELEFTTTLTKACEANIILDLSHLIVTNYNLKRNLWFGLDQICWDNVIEIHVAGINKNSETVWHDGHNFEPDEFTLNTLKDLIPSCKNLGAITFEHDPEGDEAAFYRTLERLGGLI